MLARDRRRPIVWTERLAGVVRPDFGPAQWWRLRGQTVVLHCDLWTAVRGSLLVLRLTGTAGKEEGKNRTEQDCGAAERMSPVDRETLAILQEGREWLWLNGNHDPVISDCMGGVVLHEISVSGLTFRHEPTQGPVTHEIAGHLHPAARVSFHGHVIRRPCFVGNGKRLVLPAFGTYAGGLNVLDDAFSPLFGNDGVSVLVLGQEGLYPIAPRLLKED